MQIAIIGAGSVGGTLGTAWAGKGHQIIYGARNVNDEKVKKLVSANPGKISATTIPDAVAQCNVVLLATHWQGVRETLQSAGNFSGKVLIDAINPLEMGPAFLEKGLLVGYTTSAGEQIAQWAKGAKVVKAFNTIGAMHMPNPKFSGQIATMFICGDDADAKKTVKQLSDELGFETVDAGPLMAARLLEPLAMLWMQLAFGANVGTNFAFKIIRK
ncbi:MAG TPA: NADPH-dependent F420 reductase [Candidatus Sulfotelmatobacter sp.]|nr:NADPH-dependent F420 reductase [Candidatus Sulfotelmatobacter sp.]